ncbi:MAG TPA: beta-ketoacyl-ACP synthase II, partial [Thermomicrobiales bacterium]|nr:beta-ketoacyl-ACP synthase II [Thermomicrobiales bacterium]
MASITGNGTARRVVVTGAGAICPVGACLDEVWASLVAGRSGIGPITRFDTDGYETRIAGQVDGFDPDAVVGKKEARRTDRYTQLAIVATNEAVRRSGLAITEANAGRVAVLIGSAMGGAETYENGVETLLAKGPRRISPFFMPMMLVNMASGVVAINLGAKANNFAPVSACASSAHAVGEAMRIIQRGEADVAVAGGAEAPITRMSVAGFSAMGALSTRNDDPQGASRPFDAGRDGFVMGEGAATVILEEREHALARGATILAELVGYGATDDANHMVQPAPGGEGAARAMGLALAEAAVAPADLSYINAHGTSTPLNEKFETAAL